MQSVFPNIPYFPCVGNNDLPVDYVMPGENDSWYTDLLNKWKDGILCKNCNMKYRTTTLQDLRKTFSYGGYYSVSIAGWSLNVTGVRFNVCTRGIVELFQKDALQFEYTLSAHFC